MDVKVTTMAIGPMLRGVCCLLCLPMLLAAAEREVIDEFDDASAWRVERNISGKGDCELSLTQPGHAGGSAMLVTDRNAQPHAQWIEKRRRKGLWDLSRWQKLHLWVRGDASRKTLYLRATDEAGKQMFWQIGRLLRRDWRMFTVDLTRDDSKFRHENPNLARIARVGIRLSPHCGYEIALDEMWLTDAVPRPVRDWPRPGVAGSVGYLKPRHVNEIEDSIVGVNLHPGVGRLTEDDIDRLAAAGVKWAARMPLSLTAPYHTRIRGALLRHKFRLHGIFSVNRLLEGQELEQRLAHVRRTVNGLKHVTRHWEIGNEPNIPMFWSDKPNPTEFGLMVKAFAQAIRAEQPDAVVISGGLVSYPLEFAKAMLDTGMGDWVNYVGIHTPRSRPEDGGRGATHAEALAAFRSLIRSYNPGLDVWQTEVQATGNVNFADVKGGITDYQQARHVARRFFVEQTLGYPASFWQLFKAGEALDHPGALLRVDGTPTLKFFAIQNVAAILDSRMKPADAAVRVHAETAPVLLWQSEAELNVADGKAFVGQAVSAPPGVNLDLVASVTTRSRELDARLDWLDASGASVEPADKCAAVRGGPGRVGVCRRCPQAFRPAGAVAARAVIRDPSGRGFVLNQARLIAHGPAGECRGQAFRRQRDDALFVAYWLTRRPPAQTLRGVCTLTIGPGVAAFREPTVLDTISGCVRGLPRPSARDGQLIFRDLPISDYAMVVADLGSTRVQARSTLLAHFKGADDLTAQFIADRFGRGRPEFWRLAGEALAKGPTPDGHPGDRALREAYRSAHELFVKRLEPVDGHVQVRGLPTRPARSERPDWRASIVNPKSRHVDRYCVDVRAPGLESSQLRVVVDGQPWPKKPWQDLPDRAQSWFVTKAGTGLRIFVVVPNWEDPPPNAAIEYVHDACVVRVFGFRDRQTHRPCLAYWAEPFEGAELPDGKVTLAGLIDLVPRRASVDGVVLTGEDTGKERVLRGVPLRRQPTLLME